MWKMWRGAIFFLHLSLEVLPYVLVAAVVQNVHDLAGQSPASPVLSQVCDSGGTQMIRRDFCKTSLALAGLALGSERAGASVNPAEEFPKSPGLTKYVSEFIVNA